MKCNPFLILAKDKASLIESLKGRLRENCIKRRLARNNSTYQAVVGGSSRYGRSRVPVKRKFESDSDMSLVSFLLIN